MARFLAPEAFSAATDDLSLLPFNLERTGQTDISSPTWSAISFD